MSTMSVQFAKSTNTQLTQSMSTMTIQFGNSTNTQLTRCVSTMTVVDKIKQLQDGTAVKLMTYYYISLS